MSIGALILQEYPSVVFQPGTPIPDPNIRLIQTSLDISDSTFSSLYLLSLELLLTTVGTLMSINVIDDNISYIT